MNIVALPLYGIGDALMSTPSLRRIKEHFRGARLTYLHMFKTTHEILDHNPYIDENLYFPFLSRPKLEGVRFFLGLRGRFDASINFYPSNRRDYNLAALLIGARVRIGHRYTLRDIQELNFLKNRTVRENDNIHNVEEDFQLLKLLGINDVAPCPLEIYLTAQEKNEAAIWIEERRLGGKAVIGFHPGSSVFKAHDKKRWPKERFAALIRELSQARQDAVFLLFGGPEEDALKEEIGISSGVAEKVYPVSLPGIRQTAALIERSDAFVTNDSGLMHLAAALQIPSVALFGPTNPAWLHPWMCPHKALRTRDCPPCFRPSPRPQMCRQGEGFSCIESIPVSDVLQATIEMLGVRKGQSF